MLEIVFPASIDVSFWGGGLGRAAVAIHSIQPAMNGHGDAAKVTRRRETVMFPGCGEAAVT
jgi:hypothetical protein